MAPDLEIIAARPLHSPSLRDTAAVFFRHKRAFVTSLVLLATVGIVYSALFPSYEAKMKVLLRRGRIDPAVTPTPSPAPAFEHDEITEEELNSEVELLHDDDILRQVVLKNGLAKPTLFSRIAHQNADEQVENAVRRLAKKLDIQPVRKSRLITVAYGSSDSRQSAAVLGCLAGAYLGKHAEIGRLGGQQTFFEEQEQKARLNLEQAQLNVIAFTRNQGVVSAELERDLALRGLSDTEASELGLKSAIAEAGERAVSLEVSLRSLPEQRLVQIKTADNPQLQEKLKSKLLELELERTELLTKFQPAYRLVQQVDQQIAQANEAIETEQAKPLRDDTTQDNPEYEWVHSERLKNQVELAGLRQKQREIHTQVAQYRVSAQRLGEEAVVQHDLEQKLKSAEDKWLLYSNKREEARIGDALDQNGLLNVTIAQPPRAPAAPKWPLWTAMGLSCIGAFGVSTGLAFTIDYLDPTLRTPDEVTRLLSSPVLASFPSPLSEGNESGEAPL